ncbi:MAG: class I SAM-dependent methyltransferase [Deltaproteobacteria bacterium]|nr:class I SAM-dependent methyltransferase [Deltaproteobacteria bacterium]
MKREDLEPFFSGDRLYGDDFDDTQVAEWYADECEAYAELGAEDREHYHYEYHASNRYAGYRHLGDKRYSHALGFGSAYGDELLPVIDRIDRITIVDPSTKFTRTEVHGVPAEYVTPLATGQLPFPPEIFDLVTCFGVLHHIANVSHVVNDLARVMKPGAYLLLREPIVSMGDWRYPRPGLTKRERGIPAKILRDMVHAAGLATVSETLFGFPITERLFRLMVRDVYNSPVAVWFDAMVSRAFAWNVNYHPRRKLHLLRPTSLFLVAAKAPVAQ